MSPHLRGDKDVPFLQSLGVTGEETSLELYRVTIYCCSIIFFSTTLQLNTSVAKSIASTRGRFSVC